MKELVPFNVVSHSPVLFWTMPTLHAERPLNIHELAMAAAIDTNHTTKYELQGNISVAMGRNIENHLNELMVIESGCVYWATPMAKDVVRKRGASKFFNLEVVLSDESPRNWESCLFHVSSAQKTRDPPDPAL